MNIVSTMVTMSIAGAMSPALMTMSLAPAEAAKRGSELGSC